MSVFTRKGSPYYYAEFVVRGRRVVRSTKTTSRREAETVEKQFRLEASRAEPRLGSGEAKLTLDQACGRYWAQHGKKLRDARNVQRWLLYIVRSIEKTTPISALSVKHVTGMISALETEGVGPISINRTITALQGVHNMAAKKWEEPVRVIDWRGLKSKETGRTRAETREKCQALLAALPLHIRQVVLFILTTGLRREEAFNVAWPRVNFENNSVNVRVKGGKDRDVLLSPEALLVLHERPREGRYVFDTKNYRRHFERALSIAEIEDFTWHDLRHTFATWMGQSGAPLEVIRDQLGHSSISVTQKYRHVVQSEVRAALQKIPTLSPSIGVVTPIKRA